MDNKICRKCGVCKDLNDFHKQKESKDGRHCYCKICAVDNAKRHYQDNKETVLPRMKVYNNKLEKQIKTIVNKIKKNLGCCFCDEFEPCCLDFHHLNPKEKEFTVSRLLSMKNVKTIIQEINKCVCVCSNCHRKIHAGYLTVDSTDQINLKEDDILINRDDIGLIGRNRIIKYCEECGIEIQRSSTNCKKCAVLKYKSCIRYRKVKNPPTREELEKMVWEMPTVEIAIRYQVSDKAIEKWCKKYEIQKPPRGYWAKKKYGKI